MSADIANDFKEGIEISRNIIEEGIAFKKLEEFVGRYNAHITIITEYEYLRGEVRAGIDPDTSKRTLRWPRLLFKRRSRPPRRGLLQKRRRN